MLMGVAIILLLVTRIGWGRFVSIVRGLSPGWVFLALTAWLLNLSIAAQRFRSLAAPHLAYHKVLEVVLIGYLLNYASMVQGVGIGAKVGLLKGEKVAVARSLAGSGAEVIFDLIFTVAVTLVFIAYVGLSKSGLGELQLWPFVLGAVLGVGLLTAIMVLGRRGGFWARFGEGLKEAMSLRRFLPNLFYTALIWSFAAASFYCLLRAAGASLNPSLPLAALAVGFVVGLVSLVPGGLGVRDVSWAYVCSLGGVALETSGTAAVFMRFMYITTVAIIVALWGVVRKQMETRE